MNKLNVILFLQLNEIKKGPLKAAPYTKTKKRATKRMKNLNPKTKFNQSFQKAFTFFNFNKIKYNT